MTAVPSSPNSLRTRVVGLTRRLARGGIIPFVRVVPSMRWSDWVVIAVIWTAIAIVSVGPAIDLAARTRGVRVTHHDMLLGQLIDAAAWLVLLRPLFSAFDATPFKAGQRLRSVAARVATLLSAAFVFAAINWAVIHTVGPFVVEDPAVLRAAALTGFAANLRDALDAISGPLVVYAILRVIVRRRERDKAAVASAEALRDARLHALTTDMRPHFLFNALNGIALLVRVQPKVAEEMIVQLADLLRATLDVGDRREQPVAEELSHLDHYLALQQMRFGARLTVRRDIAEETLGALLPPMLLQPLAENALGHGIEPKPGPGTLDIIVRRDGGDLVLSVRDDGVGIASTQPIRERIGLANTRERLALLYGDAGTLTIESATGGGTLATIRLPFRASRANDAAKVTARSKSAEGRDSDLAALSGVTSGDS
jgi:signal transduction histidine kinase